MKNTVKPVTEAEKLAHEAGVIARINADVRRRARLEVARWVVVAACIPAAASGWVVWATHPRVVREIEFVPVAEDGTPLMALRDIDLPPEARKLNVQNSIINYVLRREEFDDQNADKNYDVVSRMSSAKVRDEYQKVNIASAETSLWQTYSGGGWIKVQYDSMEDLGTPYGYADVPPAYLVRFCRQVKQKNKITPERAELWGATVGFKYDVKGYDGRLIRAYNPGKVQITDYPNVRPIGPMGSGSGNQRNGCNIEKGK